jgi:hypothetical protein
MSMQKKTLAILVALSVGASFGALANGSENGHHNGKGHYQGPQTETPVSPKYFWKRGRTGGGISERGNGHLASHGGKVHVESYTIEQKIINKNNDITNGNVNLNWDQDVKDNDVDADADANPDLTVGQSKRHGKKRYSSYRKMPGSEADLDRNVANGGTARLVATQNMKFKTGDATANGAAFNGIGVQNVNTGLNVGIQSSVNVNGASQF